MSLMIEERDVTEVLLADGWHRVVGRSFALDEGGFQFKATDGTLVSGPPTAILAVRSLTAVRCRW